ncbi:MAG: TIR domain-containing protein [Sporichthyaceae bacterium]
MVSDETGHALLEAQAGQPLLFISHRHADKPIADVLRKFITDRSGGRIRVFQSSSAEAQNPRAGHGLGQQLKQHLWEATVVILVYTSRQEDWSYCMWECGVATLESPETRIIVLRCGPDVPQVYSDAVVVDAREITDIQKLTSDFLTSADFFPAYGEALAPGFSASGEEVQDAAGRLHAALTDLIVRDSGEDWATVPFLRLQLSYDQVDHIKTLKKREEGTDEVLRVALVSEINGEGKRLFGLGLVEPLQPFSQLVDAWRERRPDQTMGAWTDELAEQIRQASFWRNPQFSWQLMRSSEDSDHAKYAPILSRVRSVPSQRFHEFDVYFNKFETDEEGALRIGFVDERQAPPLALSAGLPPD